jgi:hypothetical protein
MSEYGLVESILASVQWDRWKFMLSAKKLCKQDVAVISHGHRDHWATNLAQMNAVLIPQQVMVPNECGTLHNLVRVDYSAAVSKNLLLTNLWTGRLRRILGHHVRKLHGHWWIARSGEVNVIFVGDLDLHETQLIAEFTTHLLQTDQLVSGVLLPSYAGVEEAHGVHKPNEMRKAVESLAFDLKDLYGTKVAALPHPIVAQWADYNASVLPALSEVTTRSGVL